MNEKTAKRAAAEPAAAYRDRTMSHEARTRDLVSRLTREEKIRMLCSHQPAVERLGLPAWRFGVEIARGVVQFDQRRETTILPQPVGLAATFDAALLERLGAMAGEEVRICHEMEEAPASLALLGPTVDMARDPRWGRNEEAYGEDPWLAGRLSGAYTRGLAGDDPRYLRTAPLLKHFYANNYENERQTTNASIPPRLKHEYYLRAFELPIREGGAVGLMTAYNEINGVEGIANPEVLELCKRVWGMDLAVSDGGDFGQSVSAHRNVETHAEAMGRILGIGADIMLDSPEMVWEATREGLERGLITEAQLDEAVYAGLLMRFRLGDFDPDADPWRGADPARLACAEHRQLAVEAARRSMVLLENDGALPLEDDGEATLAVVGPLSDINYRCWYCGYAAEQTTVVEGLRQRLGAERVRHDEGLDHVRLRSRANGRWIRLAEDGALVADARTAEEAACFELCDWDFGSITLRDLDSRLYVSEAGAPTGGDPVFAAVSEEATGWFVRELLRPLERRDGALILRSWQDRVAAIDDEGRLRASNAGPDQAAAALELELVSSGSERVRALAKQSTRVLVVLGNHPLINAREEYDRPELTLPSSQRALLEAASGANEETLLQLVAGYPFAIDYERSLVRAVLWASHLGPSLGHVVAATLYGENNPSGRLPQTWYHEASLLPALDDYDIQRNRQTYLYLPDEAPNVLYPFGYGLSYSAFRYGEATLEVEGETIAVDVEIENVSQHDGDEVVQLYALPPEGLRPRPLRMLRAFERVHVPAGETRRVRLELRRCDLAFWDSAAEDFVVEAGRWTLAVGPSSAALERRVALDVDGVAPRPRAWQLNAIDVDDYRDIELRTDLRDGEPYVEFRDWRAHVDYHGLAMAGEDSCELIYSSPAGSLSFTLIDLDRGVVLGTVEGPGTGSFTRFAALDCQLAEALPRDGHFRLRVVPSKQACLKRLRGYRRARD